MSGCWLWQGSTDRRGYGQVRLNRKLEYTHRRTYDESRTEPLGERIALHSCDTPACCNPEHISPGTHADNVADKVAKGRQPRGEKHGQSKLSMAERWVCVLDTRPARVVAAELGVHANLVMYYRRVARGRKR